MKLKFTRLILLFTMTILSVVGYAGTLTVTSPTNGQFLGLSNSLTFTIRQASVQVRVQALVTSSAGSTTINGNFNPGTDGTTTGSLALNFSASAPQGDYTIVVSATEVGGTYIPTTLNVKVDTQSPKLLQFSPTSNSFVKGLVRIAYKLQEQSLKEWRITVNNQDIPNNSGTSETNFNVVWDTARLERDGNQSINLAAKDVADNPFNHSINVTLDRLAPNSTISFPRRDTPIRPGTDITVIIDVSDQFAESMDSTGLDIVIQRTDGVFITRAARVSFASQGSGSWRWIGRIRYRRGVIPNNFKILVNAVDKAGNTATRQEQSIRMGG